MSELSTARDDMIIKMKNLEPGSDEILKQAKVVEIMSREDREDRRLEFEKDKEETRRMEKSNESSISWLDVKLKGVEIGVKLIDSILNNGTTLKKTSMNNKVRILRDNMGYGFEENGVVGSHTLNNAQKDHYD